MTTAKQRWSKLDADRHALLFRCERYAAFTLPKIFPPQNYNQVNTELQHDYQALGGQAVNHASNKIMLTMFAPSRPFMKMDMPAADKAGFASVNIDENKLAEFFSIAERKAMKRLDKMGVRPKLFECVKHLLIVGNSLMVLEQDTVRVVGLRRYVVKRSITGRVIEIILAERVKMDELEPDVQKLLQDDKGGEDTDVHDQDKDKEVTVYKWITYEDGKYLLETWVDDTRLEPAKFQGKFTDKTLPYRALTWDLADEADYGTGLVEDYAGDFASLSMLSEAQVQAGILSSEFRWLVNPTGMTTVSDLENSANGAALAGANGDVNLIQSGKSADLQVLQAIIQEYSRRIAQGFLMGSAVTRNAERVTAEEIRMQANELETALGGVYSRLAVDMQMPIAYWLIAMDNIKLEGSSIEPTIVTGLDALSRNGDLDNVKQFLGDLAGVAALPPTLQQYLKLDAIASAVAAGRGIQSSLFIKSQEEVQQEQQAAAQAQNAQQMDAHAGQTAIDTAAASAQQPQGQ